MREIVLFFVIVAIFFQYIYILAVLERYIFFKYIILETGENNKYVWKINILLIFVFFFFIKIETNDWVKKYVGY